MTSAAPYVFNLGTAFDAVARRHESRPAIRRSGSADVSYGELAAEVRCIASRMREAGIGRGSLVALQNSKTVGGYATMLACLTVGAVYTNLDANNPAERLIRILSACSPDLLICDAEPALAVEQAARTAGVEVSRLSELSRLVPLRRGARGGSVIGSDTAYVMFTSGSTGMPKGVAISHASLLNFTEWSRTTFEITPDDVFAGVNPVYFDNSVFDFYSSLFNGACLAPMAQDEVADGRVLIRLIDETGCTVWFSVPSLLIYLMSTRALQPSSFGSVRTIVFGGEGYPKRELSKLMDLYGHRSRLFNVYGPTECTCICSAHLVARSDVQDGEGLPTLGRIAPNFDYLVLAGDVPVAAGEQGELCLMGPQVGQGYYNDPLRTAQAFVTSPVQSAVPQRMYRTGDIVRVMDGDLYFVGRRDNQIKHMGYRIELEEIEAAIAALSYVSQAAVVYKRVREGFGHIVAHVAAPDGTLDEARLRTDLKAVLPTYMMPNRLHIAHSLPKNANGKIDRVALKDL